MENLMRSFMIDLESGEQAEKDFAKVLQSKMKTLKYVQKVDYKKFPYDLRVTFASDLGDVDKTVEVKSLAGGYPTGVVEVWANDSQTKRPRWHHSDVDIIAFRNEQENMWYMYDAQRVIAYLQNYTGPMTRCRNGNNDNPGWIVKFLWDEMSGFIMSFRGE